MAEYVNVAVDAMGGDNAPAEIVKGAVEAVNADKRVKVFLVGKEPVIREELKAYSYDAERFRKESPFAFTKKSLAFYIRL